MKQTVCLLFLFTCTCCRLIAQPDGNDIILQNTLQNYVNAENTSLYKGSSLPVFSHKEDTKGNRYLFDKWVKGTILTANNYTIDNKDYLFNFDKITNDIFMTLDQKVVVEINKVEFKSFTLHSEDTSFTFKHVDAINTTDFFQVLAEHNTKYSLYKKIHTLLIKSNYTTDGIFENGKPYDEYVDHPDYFIVFPGGKIVKKVTINSKQIKNTLSMEQEKLHQYYAQNKDQFITENFLIGLINYINQ